MTTRRNRSALLAAAALALSGAAGAGCAGGRAEQAGTGGGEGPAEGTVVAAVGEPVELGVPPDAEGEPRLTVVVDAITPGAPCLAPPSVAEAPENGRFLRLDLTATTGPGYDPAGANGAPSLLTGWSVLGPDGTVLSDVRTYPASVCADGDDAALSAMRRDRTYRAVLVLDVPADLTGAALVLDGGAGPDRTWPL